MLLKGIGMIAADTSRTIYYLDGLIKERMFPEFVLVLINKDEQLLPGQENSKSENKLIGLLEFNNIPYKISEDKNINSNEVVQLIGSRHESIFIFSGFGGVLLREDILSTGKKFLHIHGGYLPDFKGSTTNYFSLIHENTIGASSIFLTKDIDCGPVLLRKKFSPPQDRTEIDHISDSEARVNVLIETLKKYINDGMFSFELERNTGGETYYIIHPVLKHIAILGK